MANALGRMGAPRTIAPVGGGVTPKVEPIRTPTADNNFGTPKSPAPVIDHANPGPAGVRALPSYEEGTDEVPEDGPAMLHKGEAVLNKDDAKEMRQSAGTKRVTKTLGGAPKKEKKLSTTKGSKKVHKIVARHAAGGGVVLEHHFNSGRPELHHHPDMESAAEQFKEKMSEGAEEQPSAPAPQGQMAQPNSFKDGGVVEKSGMAKVHKGEVVIPAGKAKGVKPEPKGSYIQDPVMLQPDVKDDPKAKPPNSVV